MVEGVVELVAMAGLVGETFLQAGVEFIAPAGELVLVFLWARLRRRGSKCTRNRRGDGGRRAKGGEFGGHASSERPRVIVPQISRCKRGGKIFFKAAPVAVAASGATGALMKPQQWAGKPHSGRLAGISSCGAVRTYGRDLMSRFARDPTSFPG